MGQTEVAPSVPTSPAASGTLPAIELIGVNKEFLSATASVVAVEDVDLQVAAGEFFSLLGPSGCGKTTTLRMLAGFEEPSNGRILLYGKDMVGVPPYRRDVNMVFQHYALFPHMNVYDNIAFGLRHKKVAKDEIERRVTGSLRLVELQGREQRRPRQLSGGQQQRVALARALVNRPRALLLDEPLGALDLKLRRAMQLELKRIQREVGITFVYVTHDQEEALTTPDGQCALRCTVAEMVYLGTSTSYSVVTDGGAQVSVYRQNAATVPGEEVAVGQVGWLSWPSEHSYVLGSASAKEEAGS